MRWVPVTAQAEIVTAAIVIEIVVKAAQCAVLKANPGETGAAGHRRSHTFHHHTDAPLLITKMRDFVADAQKKPFSFLEN